MVWNWFFFVVLELGEESPPEPAPPEVPPRGPSLTLRSARLETNPATYVFPSQGNWPDF